METFANPSHKRLHIPGFHSRPFTADLKSEMRICPEKWPVICSVVNSTKCIQASDYAS